MKEKNILNEVKESLQNEETTEEISEIILESLNDITMIGQAGIMATALINGYNEDKLDELDRMTTYYFSNINLKAFYLGIDWILKQLGNETILEQLPDYLQPNSDEMYFYILEKPEVAE